MDQEIYESVRCGMKLKVDVDNFKYTSQVLKSLERLSLIHQDKFTTACSDYKKKIKDSFQIDFENYLERQAHLFDRACWFVINRLQITDQFRKKYQKQLNFGSTICHCDIYNRSYIQKIILLYEVNVNDSYNAVITM